MIVLTVAGAPTPLRAQGVAADSMPATSTGASAPDPAARNARGEQMRPWHRKPSAIMARSALLPGWGQWVNGRPWKALGVTALEAGAGFALLTAQGDAEDALDRLAAAESARDEAAAAQATADYDDAYAQRTTWAWVLGTTLALSMLDAYVDAHLLQFDADFGPDPVPLSDEGAAHGRAHRGLSGFKAGVRLTFTGP